MQLLDLYQNGSEDKPINAQRCLLCFISWEIEKVCSNLEKQFGTVGGFTSRDLLLTVERLIKKNINFEINSNCKND